MTIGVVYVLYDTRSKEVFRYVGKTVHLEKRLKDHRRTGGQSYVGNWIRSIGPENLGYRILEEVLSDGPETLEQAEIRWIAYGRRQGWPLTNLTNGGDGTTGWIPSIETRRKIAIAKKGMKLSEEHRTKMSKAQKGHAPWNNGLVHTEESRLKMSKSHLGMPGWSKGKNRQYLEDGSYVYR